jgi:hypothetical protein
VLPKAEVKVRQGRQPEQSREGRQSRHLRGDAAD